MLNEAGLRAGIIAAGWGERLRDPHSDRRSPKALVRVHGRPLIEHVLDSVGEAKPEEVVIIINQASRAVSDYVSSLRTPFAVRWIVETTPSSMHSFLRVLEALSHAGPGPFLISTVDTIAPHGTFLSFVRRAAAISDADVVLALTEHVDDEKPLVVKLCADAAKAPPNRPDEQLRVVALGEKHDVRSRYATAGYYWVHPRILREANAILDQGQPALRKFFGHLRQTGYRLYGLPMPCSVDVDRPQDLETAERFLLREY